MSIVEAERGEVIGNVETARAHSAVHPGAVYLHMGAAVIGVLSLALLAPAVLDTVRYFFPGTARWSAWVSRGTKLSFVGLNFTF